jgi:hypothetical protein
MNPTPDQNRRLIALYRYWLTVDPESVDLDIWACDTHACLGGHATQIPRFIDEGLRLSVRSEAPRYNNTSGTEALYLFFGEAGADDEFELGLFSCSNGLYFFDEEEPPTWSHWQEAHDRMVSEMYVRGLEKHL